MKPSFLVIGAQKCATSSLCDMLGRHPDVFTPDPREPNFFSHADVWQQGWDWYESLFAGAEGVKAIGEGSTAYTMQARYPETAPRIARHLPEARLIYIVRDPLERMVSHWMHMRARGNREKLPFNEAVRNDSWYLDNSLYSRQINVYRDTFPDDQILVLFFEDFIVDPGAVVQRCLVFLEVGPDFVPDEPTEPRNRSSEGRVDGPLTAALRRAPFFEQIHGRAPAIVRETLRRIFKRPIGARPECDPETRRWVMQQVAEDSRAFLRRYGKPADFWRLG